MSTMDTAQRTFGGRFRAVRVLKIGDGVATIEGVDVASGQPVIVKTAAASDVSPSVRRRLEHEAAALREIASPFLTPLLDVGCDGDRVYLVVPLVAGVTLERRLAAGPLPVADALAVARCLLAGLGAAHERGILHRDVKPANVIVDDAPSIGRAVLIDFGLARSHHLAASLRNLPAGTVRYMSPEQSGILDRGVDARSDLYAAGVVLFECLAGRPPFAAPTVGELLRLHLSAPPPSLASLGVAVPAALDDIVQRLLRKDPRDRYQSAEAAGAHLDEIARALARGVAEPVISGAAADRFAILTEAAFIGRREEIDAFDALIAGAAAGAGALALLEAESGGGKTRLLDEVARRAAQKGAWVLRGRGLDQAAQRPFQVLEGVVQELALAAGAEADLVAALCARLGDHADTICATFPQLAGALGQDAVASVGPEEFAELRGVPALAALLGALGTAARPAVVLLDDCQWADELSAKLIAHWQRGLGAEGERAHVLVVVAFRSEEVDARHPLRGVTPAAHVRLAAFGDADVRDLVESMAGAVAEEAVALVTRLSEGSPFMATAVLRGLVEGAALRHEPQGWRIEPEAMAAAQASRRAAPLLARRLELLPPAALSLLSVGAVLGKEFDLDHAVAVAGETHDDASAAISEARRRHLVWADADGARCTFVHDKVREALLDRLSPDARRRWHLRSAQHIEAQDRTRVFELAYHFDAGGEPARALPHALAAAESARARHGLEVAERYYHIAARGASGGDDAVLRVAEGLGDVLMLRGRYDEAAEALQRARTLARDGREQAALEGKLGELAFKRGDMKTASEAIERALALLGCPVPSTSAGYGLGLLREVAVQAWHTLAPGLAVGRRAPEVGEVDRLAARLYSRLAYAYWFQRGRVPCAWAHLREMNLMERYPATLELAQAYSEHAPVMTMVPNVRRGIAYAERSLAIRTALGDVWGQGQSLHFYGVALYAGSRFTECIARCREAVRLLERTGDRWEVNTAGWHIAFSHYRLGELARAVEESRRVYQAGREIGDRQASGISLGVWAKASRGQVPRALIAAELAEPSEDVHTTAEVLQAEALRLLAEHRPAEAVAALERAQARVDAAGLRQEYVAPILPWLATALRQQAEAVPSWAPGERRALLRRARSVARRAERLARRYRNNLPHALREQGLLAAMMGRARRAFGLLTASVAEAERQGARAERAESRLARARVGVLLDRPRAAEEEAEAARALAAIGLEVDAAGADAGPRDTPFLADRFAALLDAGRRIASARTRAAIFGAVRDSAQTLLRGETCALLEAVETPHGWEIALAPSPAPIEFSRTIARRALDTGRPLIVVEGLHEDAGASVVLAGVRSVLCAPFFVRGAAAGCLYATHRRVGGLFDEDDERVAEFVAVLAGAALEQALGFAEIEALLADKRQAAARFRSLIENGSDLITVLAADGTVRYVSPSLERIRGYRPDELIGRSVFEDIHPDDRAAVARELAQGLAQPGFTRAVELRVRHRDGTWRWLEAVGRASRDASGELVAIVNSRDVTERRALEEQLRHGQRMEAVGRLAGGIAHDFNNLLTVILGRSHVLRAGRATGDPAIRQIDLITETAERAAALTHQLLAFGRRQVLEPKVLDLNAVVRGMEEMLRRLIGEQIELVVELERGLGAVVADPAQIEQVILNLAVNARDAMPDGGRLTISTANGAPADFDVSPLPGPRVRLSVADTGLGMDAVTRASVFEPFFTTKEAGDGSGLGLATVHGIVEQSGGRIVVDSAPGEGARFHVDLPRIASSPADTGTPAPPEPSATGRETLLLAEDQTVLRELFREVLEERGYTVLAAANGIEALEILRRHGRAIDLVVTDVVMPGMGGPDLVARLHERWPDLRALYMTGYADDAVLRAGGHDGRVGLLRKPFDPPALGAKVREILDAPAR